MNNSRSEYERRMHRVLAYIDEHLDAPLDLDTLAGVANFSSFHFHRLFSAWMGETFGVYLRRRRVEVAARRLVGEPGTSVLSIALSVGFGSGEAFTRAFNKRFGCSPSRWRADQARRERKSDQVVRKNDQAKGPWLREDGTTNPHEEDTTMNVSIQDRQPTTIAYLRHHGPYGESIGRFWQEVYVPWAIRNKLGPNHARYGIGHDDPEITAPEQCRYDACAEVPDDFVATGGAFKTTLPGGRYAVLDFKGTVAQVAEAWSALLRDWLPSSGLQLDARPCFEYYPAGASHDPETGAFECQICIPVTPL